MSFGDCNDKDLEVQLFDVNGVLILEKNISPALNNTLTINDDSLSHGIYFLKIGIGNRFLTKKIIAF